MKILVVDDEAALRSNLSQLLSLQGHHADSADNGKSALAKLREGAYDLVFTDVRMPTMDGYALCRAVKSDPRLQQIPFIFVSGIESIEARIEAFDAGGEDFIVKPFQVQEVVRKVDSAARIIGEASLLREAADEAQTAALAAMSWANEIGMVLEFMRRSLACEDRLALADALREAASQFGLESVVQVRGGGSDYCIGMRGRNIPLDISVMNHVRLQGRLFEFQNRSVFNFGDVTLMITNMPREDEERCGRLRDHLALLAEAADARQQAISLTEHKVTQAVGVGAALATAEKAIGEITIHQERDRQRLLDGMALLQQNLAKVFVGCGLNEAQEASIVAVVEEHVEETGALLEKNRLAGIELERIAAILHGLAVPQKAAD